MVDIQIISPDGKSGTIPEEDKEAALAQGYKIPGSGATPAEISGGPLQGESLTELHPTPPELENHEPVTPLVNKKTGEEDYVPTNQVIGKLIAGTHAYPESTKEIQVISPEGKPGTIPKEDLPQAISQGYKLSNPRDLEVNERVKELQSHGGLTTNVGETNAFESGIRNSSLGQLVNTIDEKIRGVNPLDENVEIANQAEAINNAQHPYTKLAGTVAAEIPALIGTGGLAEAGAAGLGVKGLAKAAVEGAIYSLPETTQAVINKDPKGAAEALALGVGFNVGLHGLLSVPGIVSDLAKGGEDVTPELAPKAAGLTEDLAKTQAENRFMEKAIGIPPTQRDQFRSQIEPLIKATGITPDDSLKVINEKIQKLGESGERIGSAIKELDKLDGKSELITPALQDAKSKIEDTLGDEYKTYKTAVQERADKLKFLTDETEKFKAQKDEAKAILKELENRKKVGLEPDEFVQGKAIDDITEADAKIKEYTKLRKSVVQEALPKITGEAKQAFNALRPVLEEFDNVSRKPDVGFADTQKLKKFLRDQTSFTDITNVGNVKKQAYTILRDALTKAEDEAAAKTGGAVVMDALQKDRAAYALEQVFGKNIDAQSAKDIGKTIGETLTGYHISHRAGIAGVAAHLTGLPHAAPIAVAGVLLQKWGKGIFEKKALSGAIRKIIGETANPHTALVKEAVNQLDLHISDKVKDLVGLLGTSAVVKAHDPNDHSLGEHLPNGGVGLNKEKQLEALKDMAHQPLQQVTNHLGDITGEMRKEGLHQVADEYTQHQLRIMKLMQMALPQDDLMKKSMPFAAQVDAKEISPATITNFKNLMQIAQDPTHLLEKVKSNTITPYDVAVCEAINPVALSKIRQALLDEAIKSKPNTTYQQRLSLSVIMGQNLDESTAQLPVLQSVYSGVSPTGAKSKPAKHPSEAAATRLTKDLPQSFLNTSQKSTLSIK